MNENFANLVTFPGPKKNKEPTSMVSLNFDDPLQQLLNGCEDHADDSEVEPAPVMEFSEVKEPQLLSKHDLINYMETQISLLREAGRRMNYYMEEIEAYLPQK